MGFVLVDLGWFWRRKKEVLTLSEHWELGLVFKLFSEFVFLADTLLSGRTGGVLRDGPVEPRLLWRCFSARVSETRAALEVSQQHLVPF